MSELKTLKELNVRPGDVVEVIGGSRWEIVDCDNYGFRVNDTVAPYLSNTLPFRIISRASDTPKLWRDMTDAEKCALFLAHCKGKSIEVFANHWLPTTPLWKANYAYRIRPESKRITVPLMADNKEIGTIDLVDGKPDQSSVKFGGAEGGEA